MFGCQLYCWLLADATAGSIGTTSATSATGTIGATDSAI